MGQLVSNKYSVQYLKQRRKFKQYIGYNEYFIFALTESPVGGNVLR